MTLASEGVISRGRGAALPLGQARLGSSVNGSVAVRNRFGRRLWPNIFQFKDQQKAFIFWPYLTFPTADMVIILKDGKAYLGKLGRIVSEAKS